MKVGIKRVFGTILVGILGGAFGGFVAILIIPIVPFDPLIWLGAIGIGAMLGAGMAIWVILRYRGDSSSNDALTKTS